MCDSKIHCNYFVRKQEDLIMNLPIEFEKKMKAFLGNEWDDFLYSYDNNRFQALRFNTLKVQSPEEIMRILNVLGISSDKRVSWANEAYYFDENVRPGKHPYHEMGLYYIQEPSAMSAAALLAPKPGMRVLDLCAAPGGKSTACHIFRRQRTFGIK